MDFTRAWQIALGQLQMEVPKASFDTWVSGTRALSFENGVLTVGTRNAYARDWLESRLTSTVSRLLVGILNAQVRVQFVVNDERDRERDEQADSEPGGFTAEPVDLTRYRDEVRPDRIVLLDAYCLRLLEQGDMTAKQMSLWVGFRQAVWHQWKTGQGTVRNIPHWRVMEFAMMSRASYFRELSGKTFLAGGHVELVPEPAPVQYRSTDRRMDNANRYRVRMAPRLTRHDCAVIEQILRAEAGLAKTQEEAEQAVLAALKNLAERDVADWINQEVKTGTAWLRSVQEIVRRVLSLKGDLSEEFQQTCEKVYDRIVGSFGKVSITHYFLRVVAPTLGFSHAQAWAIITLRDRCWYDHQSQTQKEFAIVRGGLDTLAKWAGASLKSVTRWLEQPAFSAFVRLADMEKLELPDEWIASGTKVILVYQQEPLLSELSNEQEIGTKRDSITDKVRPYFDQDETLSLTKRDSTLDKMRLYLGQSETRLNNLIKPLLNLKQPHQATTRSASALRNGDGFEKAVAVDFSSWDVNRILEINHVHPKLRKKLTGVDAHWLLSWLLYAMSQAGRGIEQPLNYALDRLSRTPVTGAGGAYDAFANLPPAELIDLILERARDREWNEIMGRGTSRPRLLLPILLGEDALKASEYTSFDQRNDILS